MLVVLAPPIGHLKWQVLSEKKGFYPELIESSSGFNNLLSEFADLPFEEDTRISAQIIITEDSLNK